MINKLYNANASVEVIDLTDDNGKGMGTRVVLQIPL